MLTTVRSTGGDGPRTVTRPSHGGDPVPAPCVLPLHNLRSLRERSLDAVFNLQRNAGNAAVAALLKPTPPFDSAGGGKALPVQRCGEAVHDGCACAAEQPVVQGCRNDVRASPQGGGDTSLVVQRATCVKTRPAGERERSRAPGGLLADDVSFDMKTKKLVIADFGVRDAAIPPGAVDEPGWQRAMSVIAGTPSIAPFVGILGYSDCLGTVTANQSLRRRRAEDVRAAMPPLAQVRVLLATGELVGNHLSANDTAENRAKNRSVVVRILDPAMPRRTDACDFLAAASDLDQYLFLIRCLERRLGLTASGDAPKTLSVLRQIYYGSAGWTAADNRNAIWDDVVTDRPWSPGTDPTPRLGKNLFHALQKSQKVNNNGQEIDIGHLLTGMDAARKPEDVTASVGPVSIQTGVKSHEWATWAGDVGSAAAQYTLCGTFLNYVAAPEKYFKNFASDGDLEGDIDSYAVWAALNHDKADVALRMDAPLSDTLLDYYRVTKSTGGTARAQRFEVFVNFYGGQARGGVIGNRKQLEGRLLGPTQEFALLFFGDQLHKTLKGKTPGSCIGKPPPPAPGRSVDLGTLLAGVLTASRKMTALFVDWLAKRV